MSSMVLLHPSVLPHPRGNCLFSSQSFQTKRVLKVSLSRPVLLVVEGLGPHSDGGHSPKEDLECLVHIVDEHPLEVLLLLPQLGVSLVLEHLENDALVDVPVTHVRLEVVKSLGLLIGVLEHPVAISY